MNRGKHDKSRPGSALPSSPSCCYSSASHNRQLARRLSAPALLRRDNMCDAFLQDIEDGSVHRCKNTLRKEKLFVKHAMADMEALQDTNLHELRTLHNRSIRTRSGPTGAEPTHLHARFNIAETPSRRRQYQDRRNGRTRMARCESKSRTAIRSQVFGQESCSTNQIKELCQTLDSSIQHHCVSFGVPEDLGLHRIRRCPMHSETLEKNLRDLYAACVRMDENSDLPS